jgi:hypothetical protein
MDSKLLKACKRLRRHSSHAWDFKRTLHYTRRNRNVHLTPHGLDVAL